MHGDQPKNKEVCNIIHNLIKAGEKVVIWPDDIQLKDVNEMIMNGLSPAKVEDIISRNTYRQLSALTKLSIWKKV